MQLVFIIIIILKLVGSKLLNRLSMEKAGEKFERRNKTYRQRFA